MTAATSSGGSTGEEMLKAPFMWQQATPGTWEDDRQVPGMPKLCHSCRKTGRCELWPLAISWAQLARGLSLPKPLAPTPSPHSQCAGYKNNTPGNSL